MLLKLRFLQPMDWKSPLVFPLCHSRSIRSRSTLLLVALKWCFYAAHAANIQSWYMEITFSVGKRFYQLQNMLVITGKKMDFWSYGAELGPGGPFDSRTFCSYPGTFWFHPRTLFWLVTSSGHYTVYMYCVRVQYVHCIYARCLHRARWRESKDRTTQFSLFVTASGNYCFNFTFTVVLSQTFADMHHGYWFTKI